MSDVFIDTSALLALLLSDDRNHRRARHVFDNLAGAETALTSSSYVLVETYALLQRRIGLEAVEMMREKIAPLVDVVWVGRSIHDGGLDRLARSHKRKLSLVDCTSFEIMRRRSLRRAFAYDKHFEAEGFELC